jgi:Deoxyribonuclease II.
MNRYWIVLIILVALITGCNNNPNISDVSSANNKAAASSSRVIEKFIESIHNKDTDTIKQITSSNGLIVIRNFSSGNGTRGKDIRNIYAAETIPSDLQFEVNGETPIALQELFKNSQQIMVNEIPIVKLDDINFSFEDDISRYAIGPSTDDVRDICYELLSPEDTDNPSTPIIYDLGNQELVLTESESAADLPVGNWAVFEKVNGQFLLKAVIDLR